MLTDSNAIAALMLSAAIVLGLGAGCPGPEPSPLIPLPDEHAAECVDRKLAEGETCPEWNNLFDTLPGYCTESGAVVDGFDWCDSEGYDGR